MNSGKKLARTIRRRGRERLRRSRDLWRDYKVLRGSRFRRGLNRLRFLIYMYPLFLLAAVSAGHGPDLPLVLLTLYSAATILTRATLFSTALYRSGDLAFCMHLPVSDRKFFDHEFAKFLRSSIVVWFFAFVAFSYVSVLAVAGPMRWAAALAAATLHWLLVISLILLLQWIAPQWPAVKVSVPLYGLACAAIFLPAAWLETLKNAIVPLPTAWVPAVFEQGLVRAQSASLWFLLPVIAIIAALPFTLSRLRGSYPRFEIVYPLMMGSFAAAHDDEEEFGEYRPPQSDVVTEQGAQRPRFRPAPITLPTIDWTAMGWLERIAARWLGPVRRRHAEFLSADQMSASAPWRAGLKIAGVGVLLVVISKDVPLWIPSVIGLIAFLVMLPLAGGAWPGMQPRAAGGTRVIPVYAVVPLSFSQISRVLITVNLPRLLAGFPFLLAYGAALGWRAGLPLEQSLAIALRLFIVLVTLQPYAILLRHSEGTNDTRVLKLRNVMALLVMLVLAVGYVISAITFFVADSWPLPGTRNVYALGAIVGLFVFPTLSWLLYKLVYNYGRIDLLRTTTH